MESNGATTVNLVVLFYWKTYTYNNKGFITSERDNGYSFEYKYDNNGNITSIKKIKLASNYINSSSSSFNKEMENPAISIAVAYSPT